MTCKSVEPEENRETAHAIHGKNPNGNPGTMKSSLTNGPYGFIRMMAALLVSLLGCHCGSGLAQQLQFASLIPSTQLKGFTIGPMTVLVVDTNGTVISNSSASVTISITGPD